MRPIDPYDLLEICWKGSVTEQIYKTLRNRRINAGSAS